MSIKINLELTLYEVMDIASNLPENIRGKIREKIVSAIERAVYDYGSPTAGKSSNDDNARYLKVYSFPDGQRIAAVKAIRAATGFELQKAVSFVDGVSSKPQIIDLRTCNPFLVRKLLDEIKCNYTLTNMESEESDL
jgi:ribosomal protein L7/L12